MNSLFTVATLGAAVVAITLRTDGEPMGPPTVPPLWQPLYIEEDTVYTVYSSLCGDSVYTSEPGDDRPIELPDGSIQVNTMTGFKVF